MYLPKHKYAVEFLFPFIYKSNTQMSIIHCTIRFLAGKAAAADTDKEAKTEAVKEQTPDTGDDKRTLAWLLMFVIGGAGVIVFGKKNKFTDKI